MMVTYAEKIEQLKSNLLHLVSKRCIVAFSGGVDSALLLKMTCESAAQSGKEVYAVTMQTSLHPVGEIKHAKAVAEEIGAKHIVIAVDELAEAGIAYNPEDRCYRCKKYLLTRIQEKSAELLAPHILEGTNADDLQMYRPGLQAVQELGIHSPLMRAGLTKEDVRRLAAEYGLSVSERPAMPCLATRFPYGVRLTYEDMKRVEEGESYLRSLGFYNVRLRVHENIARIEVDEESIESLLVCKKEIISFLKQLKYDYITLDLEGFRSGSMDIHIKKESVSSQQSYSHHR
ncbi:ATP-dependent sacrificial sulfur transferase LarE [Mediterraneibacter agrestimuris]